MIREIFKSLAVIREATNAKFIHRLGVREVLKRPECELLRKSCEAYPMPADLAFALEKVGSLLRKPPEEWIANSTPGEIQQALLLLRSTIAEQSLLKFCIRVADESLSK